MRLSLFVIVGVIGVCAPAQAQLLGERIPGQRSDVGPAGTATGVPAARRAKPAGAARPCAEYGPGFMRLEGSTTCMRAGGKVIYEYGATSHRRSDMPATGSRSAFVSEIETRTPTEAGPFRMVVRGVVVRDTGAHRTGAIAR